MSKHIQAYFRTEDDAESARFSLAAYPVEHLEVGRMAEDLGANHDLLIPVAPFGNTTGMYSGGAQSASGVPVVFTAQDSSVLENENVSEAERDIKQDRPEDDDIRLGEYPVSESAFEGDNYGDLQYVLSAKVQDQDCDGVVQKLRKEGGYVEVLD